ncbi:hypothetical protein COW46_04945 [Candidatus Gracilibacteria bacterium CG17_big_fil_post_rev_8_21_14_2_50_48_13]|nr:MAG: hypothetical protein COW46_04945 [Candidatus Gracilibacteria bacterium CG17_big_fil_post_rev_8_21_14_2_50_48_13]
MKRLFALCCLALAFSSVGIAQAATNIDSTNQYAWSENIGWISFGSAAGDVQVRSDRITGYAWSQQLGWINMAPTLSGVMRAANDTFSGYAWGENTGYIDFSGVSMNSNGYFHGTATGPITGTINFNCANYGTCGVQQFAVQAILPSTTSTSPYSGGGGGFSEENIPELIDTVLTEPLKGNQPDNTEAMDSSRPPVLRPSAGSDLDAQLQTFCAEHPTDENGNVLNIVAFRDILETCGNDPLRCPRAYMTRGAFVQLLLESQCIDLPAYNGTLPFSDLTPEHYAYADVAYAYNRGWVMGYGDNTYKPDQPISRIEAATILIRYFLLSLDKEPASAVDVTPSAWYSSIAPTTISQKILSTTITKAGRYLFPNVAVTRTELRGIIHRVEDIAKTRLMKNSGNVPLPTLPQ